MCAVIESKTQYCIIFYTGEASVELQALKRVEVSVEVEVLKELSASS